MCVCPVRKVQTNGTVSYFPCGHCYQCLKAYQDQWSARLAEECKAWKPVWQQRHLLPPVVFFTLKYRNDSIPCKYLNLSPLGWSVTDVPPPGVKVLEMWTDTRRESKAAWKFRRVEILKEYRETLNRLAGSLPDVVSRLSQSGVPVWNYEESSILRFDSNVRSRDPRCLNIEFFENLGESCGFGEIPSFLRGLPEAYPVLSVEFHTVSKSDVQGWLKRSRRRFERAFGVEDGAISDRQYKEWTDQDGEVLPLPSSCLTKTFKYFITSEYGPRTHRPHYHGVIFGITYEEFVLYFQKDWEDSFGSVDCSPYDSSRGGMTYLSKYCSKGGYEHPYCRKDFFFEGGEFHSKHFEDSIRDFGVDRPLVAPTFHLISKGIGARYAFSPEIQKYFGVRLAHYLTSTGKVRYMASDDSELREGLTPSLPLNELFVGSYTPEGFESESFSLCVDVNSDGSLQVTKWTVDKEHRPKFPVSTSRIPLDGVVDATIEALEASRKYNRTYVKSKSSLRGPSGQSYRIPRWHFIPDFSPASIAGRPQIKSSSISLPRYYRQFLLSPLASALRAASSRRLHPALDAELKRAVFDHGLRNALGPSFQPLVAVEQMRYQDGYRRFRERSNVQYSPSGVYEID